MSRPHMSTLAAGIVIRRAELDDVEAVLESAWKLTQDSTAARWSRAAFYPYVSNGEASGALQAKCLFLACANPSTGASEPGAEDPRGWTGLLDLQRFPRL